MKTLLKILVLGTVFMVFSLLSARANAGNDTENSSDVNYNAKFYGVIEHLPESGREGLWIVNNREVLVTQDTKIKEEFGKAEVGAYVEIEGDYVEKTFTAYKVKIKKEGGEETEDQ